MRGPLPLDDDDFAAIRAQVMAKVGARPRVRVAPWLAFATSVVVAVVSVFVARVPVAAPPLTRPTATLSPLRGARDTRVTPPSAPLPLAGEGGAKRRVRVARQRKPTPPTAVARIEIQTADPDVRIIWFTSQEEIQ